MFKRLYNYFILYMGVNPKDGSTRICNCRVVRFKKIKTFADIEELEKDIGDTRGWTDIHVLNYKYLKSQPANSVSVAELVKPANSNDSSEEA